MTRTWMPVGWNWQDHLYADLEHVLIAWLVWTPWFRQITWVCSYIRTWTTWHLKLLLVLVPCHEYISEKFMTCMEVPGGWNGHNYVYSDLQHFLVTWMVWTPRSCRNAWCCTSMFMLKWLQGCPKSFWVRLVGVWTYVRGDGGSRMWRRRRAGLIVSLTQCVVVSSLKQENLKPLIKHF